eukprot:COSAG02_NODE_2793_length_8017_cov_6.303738_3_plen_667_part_00
MLVRLLLVAPAVAALIIGVARSQVVLNEVLANPDAEPAEEWAELYNVGSEEVELGGWSLSDSNGHGSSGSVTLEPGTNIAPGDHLVVVLRASDGLLNNGADDVELYNPNGELVDEITWTNAHGDLSLSRVPDGGEWSANWAAPTRGETNGAASTSSVAGGLAASLATSTPAGGVASCATSSHAPLRVGSWNIQNFGNAKSGRPAVMDTIGGVAARYDVLSVQELSQMPTNPGPCSVDGTTGAAACSLLAALNVAAAPRTFALAASPRACTVDSCTAETYNEQYMAVWDVEKIELLSSAVYPDPDGEFERDPWAVHLREITSETEFALLAIHTPPSAAEAEVLAMGSVLSWAATSLCDNVLLVGDFNADGSYANEDVVWSTLFAETHESSTLGNAFVQVVDNAVDTTVAASSNTYDRIIISASLQSASIAAGGGVGTVFAFDQELDLSGVWTEGCGSADYISAADCAERSIMSATQDSRLAAQEISDHLPVELTLCLEAAPAPPATCDAFTCPTGEALMGDVSTIGCAGATCTASECCEAAHMPPATCDDFTCHDGDVLMGDASTIGCAGATCTASECCIPSCGDARQETHLHATEDADAFALSDCAEGLVLKSDPLTIGCPSGTCASDDCCEAPPMPSTDDTGSSSAPRAYAAMAVGAAAVLASKL